MDLTCNLSTYNSFPLFIDQYSFKSESSRIHIYLRSGFIISFKNILFHQNCEASWNLFALICTRRDGYRCPHLTKCARSCILFIFHKIRSAELLSLSPMPDVVMWRFHVLDTYLMLETMKNEFNVWSKIFISKEI